ncbi:MAG: hypothetical protein BJ554DRAFT_8281, partial [Olpidium bornovanus]
MTVQQYKKACDRASTQSLGCKSLTDLRREASKKRARRKQQKGETCAGRLSLKCRRFATAVRKAFRRKPIWDESLQQITSRFGSAILAYFSIFRWTYLLNVFLACVWLATVLAVGLISEFRESEKDTPGVPRVNSLLKGTSNGALYFFSGR